MTTAFEFNGMIWTKMQEESTPLTSKDQTNKTMPPTIQKEAKPKDAHEHVSCDDKTKPKSTTKWQTKTPASTQPSASIEGKPTTEWQTKLTTK